MKSFQTLFSVVFLMLVGLVSNPLQAQDSETYSQAELDQMLAPIALYPDTVLSHVLIAATYPLEVVQAARWSRNHPGLSGQEAVDRVENEDWDPSVKALVAFPELLDRMDRDIAWTQSLGDAFLAQEGDVTDSIQYLRNQAYDNGQLQSNAQVNVVRETRYIYIEPAQPQVVYVPYYDPRVVYGPWRWAAYPPVYWHHPPGFSLSLGFYWGIGFHVHSSFFFSSFYWPSRHVVVVDHHYHQRYPNYGYRKGHGHYRPAYSMAHYDGASRWQHNSQHRRGVSYRGHVDNNRFDRDGGRNHSAPARTAQNRRTHRDWADQQRSDFAGNMDQSRRGDRSRSPSGNSRPGERSRSGGRGRTAEPVSTRDNQVVENSANSGQRSGNSRPGRRPAPLDAARDGRGVDPGQDHRQDSGRSTARNDRRSSDGAIERLRRDLDASGTPRRSNSLAAPRSRRASQDKVAKSDRSVLPASDSQPRVTWNSNNDATPAPRQSNSRNQRVTRPAASAGRSNETRFAAATPQRKPQQSTAPRQAPPQRQATQQQAAARRQSAPQSQPRQERSAQSPRSDQSTRAESRANSSKSGGRGERSGSNRGAQGKNHRSRN